ncbi:MAG: helix-turn-helix domain-containing protein [Phenylobacterium sp.]
MHAKTDAGPADPAPATASVTYHLPAPALREAVTTYYLVKVAGDGVVRDQIFPEWPNFRMILSGDWTADFPDEPTRPVPVDGVTGALERAVWVSGTAGLMVGVGLMPQGWPRFTDLPADAFANRMRPMTDALGPVADDLHRRLCEAAADAAGGDEALFAVLDDLLPTLLRPTPQAALVAAAHTALQDSEVQTVSGWAEAVSLSPRQLERFSRRYFGLSPKRLLRRQRLLRTLAAMREAPQGAWTQFLDAQYADQAHFIHEFNYYMGMSPKAYLARNQPFMAEAWKRRKALLGSPVQVLQPATSEKS